MAAVGLPQFASPLVTALRSCRVVGELMATGEYDRHIRRMLCRYRARREALICALRTHLGSAAQIRGGGAGLHIVVWLLHLDLAGANDVVAACQARNVGVYSLAPHAMLPFRHAALLLGYGLVELEAIKKGPESSRTPIARS